MNREAPRGFVVVNDSLWAKCHLTDAQVAELSESQLAKVGLMNITAWREKNGQEGLDL